MACCGRNRASVAGRSNRQAAVDGDDADTSFTEDTFERRGPDPGSCSNLDARLAGGLGRQLGIDEDRHKRHVGRIPRLTANGIL